MSTYLWILLLLAVPTLVFVGGIYFIRYRLNRDRRRSPLNTQLWNLPGEGLRRKLEEIDEQIGDAGLNAIFLPPFLMIVWLVGHVDAARLHFHVSDVFFIIACLGVVAFSLRKAHTNAAHRRKVRDGLAAELTVAQYLLPLVAEGCMVFHDIPAENFNLDHVVIGPQAVFLIETKSRKKPATRGVDAAKVHFDGEGLRFPDHTETAPLEQARSEARWLANYLKDTAGEPVKVLPVLALPGWWVEPIKGARSSDVVVSNLKSPQFLLNARFGTAMSDSLRKRVAHAITLRYPQVGS